MKLSTPSADWKRYRELVFDDKGKTTTLQTVRRAATGILGRSKLDYKSSSSREFAIPRICGRLSHRELLAESVVLDI